MLIYDNWCKYDKNFFFFNFSKKMGRSGDGKQSIKLGWPYWKLALTLEIWRDIQLYFLFM